MRQLINLFWNSWLFALVFLLIFVDFLHGILERIFVDKSKKGGGRT